MVELSFRCKVEINTPHSSVASRKNEKAPQNASESFGVTAEPIQKTSEKDSSKRHVKDAKGPVKDAKSSLKDTNEEIEEEEEFVLLLLILLLIIEKVNLFLFDC